MTSNAYIYFAIFLCYFSSAMSEGSSPLERDNKKPETVVSPGNNISIEGPSKKLPKDTQQNFSGPLNNSGKLFQDLHLLMGIGTTYSLYKNEDEEQSAKLGPAFKADVIYIFDEKWAFEFSGTTSYVQFSKTYAWNTLLTMGIRYLIGESRYFDASWFSRFYVGHRRSVLFVTDEVLEDESYTGDINRIHFGGEAIGLGTGLVWETKDSQIHFIELNAGIHFLKNQESVNIQNEVPVVIANNTINDSSRIYNIHLTYGVLLF